MIFGLDRQYNCSYLMARAYDNWERLVNATLRREELRLSGQRTPSNVSSAASSGRVLSFNFPNFLVGESFSYDQILQSTNYLSKNNLIKNGHSGDLFSGILEDGIPVVVRKMGISSADKESEFISQVEIFGKVSHSRLVPFLGYCLENIEEKFLVYKYMPNKDLLTSMYKKIVQESKVKIVSLDWITRLKIAIGTAEALCYLHSDFDPPFVHRDIQASSILLDDKFEVRLGSLMKVSTAKEKDRGIARFMRLPKASGQGVSGQSNATCEYDVYCFGKVLLELVIGYLGFRSARKEEMMANALSYISKDDMELVVKIIDPSLIIDEDFLTEVWAVAIVAKACLHRKPLMRPKMADVLEALENPLKVVTEGEVRARFSSIVVSLSPDRPGTIGPPTLRIYDPWEDRIKDFKHFQYEPKY